MLTNAFFVFKIKITTLKYVFDLQAKLLVFLEPVKQFRKNCSSLDNWLTFPMMTTTVTTYICQVKPSAQCSPRKEVIRLSFIDEKLSCGIVCLVKMFYNVSKPYWAQWSKDGNPINLKDLPPKYEVEKRKHILIIKRLKFEDKGSYTCNVGWRQPSSG